MFKKGIVALMVMSLLVGGAFVPNAHAEQDTGRLIITKLFRGLTNAVTGWIEIPKQATYVYQEQGPGAGFTWGILKGLGWAIVRSVGGGYEIVTFPFPAPEGYGPIMEPEYVLTEMSG